MDSQQIALHDPYLAGSLAARSWDWYDETTPEQEADRVGLAGERRADFLRGWNAMLAEDERERKAQLVTEYDQMATGYERGDPAAW